MKQNLFILLFLLIISIPLFGQKKLEVLFLGNSYTYVNDLPALIAQIALSKGDTLVHDQNTPGGYTFQGHSIDATSLSKINARSWDYVVLQEQSQMPAFPPSQVATDVYPYADSLNKYIKRNDSCTNTLFFMTWGRQNGDASNCASYPPICTYEGMQASLRQSYMTMTQTLNAVVAPVGVVWKKVRNQGDSILLYNADESHPSLAGSYLAACTFYATMFHKSPIGSSYYAGLNPATALHLQQYAAQVVFDSLALWQIDTLTAHAAFSMNANQNNVTITNTSLNADAYYWDFGDGQTYSGNTTSHTYATTGTFTVKLVAYRGCTSSTVSHTIGITSVGIENAVYAPMSLMQYPSPANDFIIFGTSEIKKSFIYTLYNIEGLEVMQGRSVLGNEISVGMLPNGMFYYVLNIDGDVFKGRFSIVR